MPETALIRVIDVEPVCSWCHIELGRDGLPPIQIHGRRFHVVCVRAYARDYADRVEAQWDTVELPEQRMLELAVRGTSDPSE